MAGKPAQVSLDPGGYDVSADVQAILAHAFPFGVKKIVEAAKRAGQIKTTRIGVAPLGDAG